MGGEKSNNLVLPSSRIKQNTSPDPSSLFSHRYQKKGRRRFFRPSSPALLPRNPYHTMFASSNSASTGPVSSQADHSHQKQHQQPELTVLEQEVIDEYQKLRDNLDKLSSIIATLTANPTSQILDSLRQLERKTGVVYTLLKASVYSIVLQQEMHDADVGGAGMGADMEEMLGDDG